MDNTGFAPKGIGVLPDRVSCPDETVRKILFVLCELFSVFSVIHFYSSGETDRILLCAVTIVLVMVPAAAERLFHCRLSTWLYVLCLMYALGALLYVLIFIFDRGRHPAITLRAADNGEGGK